MQAIWRSATSSMISTCACSADVRSTYILQQVFSWDSVTTKHTFANGKVARETEVLERLERCSNSCIGSFSVSLAFESTFQSALPNDDLRKQCMFLWGNRAMRTQILATVDAERDRSLSRLAAGANWNRLRLKQRDYQQISQIKYLFRVLLARQHGTSTATAALAAFGSFVVGVARLHGALDCVGEAVIGQQSVHAQTRRNLRLRKALRTDDAFAVQLLVQTLLAKRVEQARTRGSLNRSVVGCFKRTNTCSSRCTVDTWRSLEHGILVICVGEELAQPLSNPTVSRVTAKGLAGGGVGASPLNIGRPLAVEQRGRPAATSLFIEARRVEIGSSEFASCFPMSRPTPTGFLRIATSF